MAAVAASAPTLCFPQGVENSCSFRASRQFCGVCTSSGGFAAARVTATRRDVVAFAGRRNTGPGNGKRPRSGMQARRKQKSRIVEDDDDDAAMEKALEALFAQLEMDLNSEDDVSGGDEQEFTDEELTQMSKELEAAFNEMDIEGLKLEDDAEGEDSGLVDMVMTDGVYSEASSAGKGSIQKSRQQEYLDDDDDDEDEEEDEEEDEDDEPRMVPLEKWQIRKLAAAVEKGRRNVNVKSLAAELGMDRSDVLSFLKDPPPDLLLMSAQFDKEDEEEAKIPEVEFDFKVNVVNQAPSTASSRKQPISPPMPYGVPQPPGAGTVIKD